MGASNDYSMIFLSKKVELALAEDYEGDLLPMKLITIEAGDFSANGDTDSTENDRPMDTLLKFTIPATKDSIDYFLLGASDYKSGESYVWNMRCTNDRGTVETVRIHCKFIYFKISGMGEDSGEATIDCVLHVGLYDLASLSRDMPPAHRNKL